MKDNHLKRIFEQGGVGYGVWAALGSGVTIEVAGRLGYDWVLVDFEHGQWGPQDALGALRATAGYKTTSIVRAPGVDGFAFFKHILDRGAEGVLLPLVRDAEEVRRAVSACRYPPQGTRGIASHRAHGYGLDGADYFARANDEILIVAQVETREALEDLDAIAEVPGLDALFVGPVDLSAALGAPIGQVSPELEPAIERVLEVGKLKGKPVGLYCRSPEDAKRWIERGVSFVNLCNDTSLLVRGLRQSLEQVRS
ncbi:MAG: aldolase/citrate lyase family protein [Myxococcales bacterium]|nr:aldolase/citrate lyase family protein [Myxococcales bacterium]